MPTIPTYEAHVGLDPDQAPRYHESMASAEAAQAQGHAIQGLGNQIESTGDALAQHMEQRQNEKDSFSAQVGLLNLQQTIGDQDTKAFQNIKPDGTDWNAGRMENARAQTNAFLSTITNPKLRDEFVLRTSQFLARQHDTYAQQQLSQQNGYFTQQINTSAVNGGNAILNDPAQFEAQMEAQKKLIASATTIPVLERQKMIQQVEQNFQKALLAGVQQRDPQAALAMTGVAPRGAMVDDNGNVLPPVAKGGGAGGGGGGGGAPVPINEDAYKAWVKALPEEKFAEIMRASDKARESNPKATATDLLQEAYRKTLPQDAGTASVAQPDQSTTVQPIGTTRAGIGSDRVAVKHDLAPGSSSSRAALAMSFFQAQGWSPVQAAGIVGNLFHESGGLKTYILNPGDGSDGSDSIGIAQWNSDRARALKQFASSQGKDWRDLGTQLAFVQRELTTDHSAAGAALKQAGDIQSATGAIALYYERPAGAQTGIAQNTRGWSQRLSYAQTLASGRFPTIAEGRGGGGNMMFSLGAPDPRLASIPFDQRLALANDIERSIRAQQANVAAQQRVDNNAWMNQAEFAIHDGKFGQADLEQARQSRGLDYDAFSRLENQINSRDKQVQDVGRFNAAAQDPSFRWNPLDDDQKKAVSAGYDDMVRRTDPGTALRQVVQQTGIVPDQAGVMLRGAIVQGSAQAQQALQIGSDLMASRPNVFASMKGGDDFANKVAQFNHYVGALGFTAADAASRIYKQEQPEFKAQSKSVLKDMNVDDEVKKNLSASDLISAFNEGIPFFRHLQLEATPGLRQQALSDYEELFRMNLQDTADPKAAKAVAIAQMKRIWGNTDVTGSPVLTRYPIDKARAYQGIDNVGERFATAAMAHIKAETGHDVERGSLIVSASPQTPAAYASGAEPPMMLGWVDKDGLTHIAQQPFAVPRQQMEQAARAEFGRRVDAAVATAQDAQARRDAAVAAQDTPTPAVPSASEPEAAATVAQPAPDERSAALEWAKTLPMDQVRDFNREAERLHKATPGLSYADAALQVYRRMRGTKTEPQGLGRD